MPMFYIHLGLIFMVCLFMLADTRYLFWDKVPYQPKDSVWITSVMTLTVVSLLMGPGVIHSFLMWVVMFLALGAILFHNYSDEDQTWKGTAKLAVCWYMLIFSLHSFITT